MSNQEILKEVQFRDELQAVINKYIKDIPAMHLMTPVQMAYAQLKAMAKQQIDDAKKECEVSDNDTETSD